MLHDIFAQERDIFGCSLADRAGEWFVSTKGCQRDFFSKGYVINATVTGDCIADVITIRYIKKRKYIEYEGHIAFTARYYNGSLGTIDKIREFKEKILQGNQDWMYGFKQFHFYH